jgi:hypothetical protein
MIRALQFNGPARWPYGGCVGFYRWWGERVRTGIGVSGSDEHQQAHAQSRGAGEDVFEALTNFPALFLRRLQR